MKKLVVIQDCLSCPYVSNDGRSGCYFCVYDAEQYGRFVGDESKIPDWCPLEDAKSDN